MVAGRFLQGVGGGGLVPATLALVADLYPADRRGVPLGVVSAVQELGSVLGPLFGAVVLAVADWRAIFLVNLAVGLVLRRSRIRPLVEPREPPGRRAAAPARLVGRRCSPLVTARRRRARLRRSRPAGPRPHLGPALRAVRRRRPLADARSAWSRSVAVVAARGALPAPPAARWSTCAAGARSAREADLARARCCWRSPWPA